jgi:hypothetical protein
MSQGSKYSDSEVKKGLALFVLASAKPMPYARLLEAHPEVQVPYGTVKRWAYTSKRDLHQQVKSELSGTVYGAMEDNALGLANSGIELLGNVAQELERRLSPDEIANLKTPELLKAWHELHVGVDIVLGKAMAIGGRPTQITRMDFPDLQRALAERHGIKLTIEGEATEEPIPELELSNA